MSILALNISELSIPLKLIKSQEWVTMGTNNSNVPGNGPALAVLSAAIAELTAQHAAYEEARQTCKQIMALRTVALESPMAAATALGVFTESATGGVASKILSAGFDVKAPPQPPQPVGQVLNVRVLFNGLGGAQEA